MTHAPMGARSRAPLALLIVLLVALATAVLPTSGAWADEAPPAASATPDTSGDATDPGESTDGGGEAGDGSGDDSEATETENSTGSDTDPAGATGSSGEDGIPLDPEPLTGPAQFSASAAVATPTIELAITSASAAAGAAVRIQGSGFTDISGAYAAIIEKDTEAAVSAGGGYVAFGYWMPPAAGLTGDTFDRTLTAATADLDPEKLYEVIVWQGHTTPDATTIYARADVPFTSSEWNSLFPPTVPEIAASVTGASEADGLEVRVQGSGFTDISGAYAAIIEKGTEAAVSAGGGYAAFGYWMPPAAGLTGDTFDRTLTAPSADLDRDTQYEVIVWQGHTNPDASTIYARADVEVSAAQWNALLPPEFGITVDAANADAGTVEVTGVFPSTYTATSGASLATGVYLMFCVEPSDEPGSGATGRAGGSGNCDTTAQKWLVQPGTAGPATPIGEVVGDVWSFTTTVDVAAEFGTKLCLDATSAADGGVSCGVAVRLDHNSGSGSNATYTFDQFVPVGFAAPEPEPSISVEVTGASEADGLEVRVQGTGFTGVSGAYAAIIEEGTEAAVSAGGGYAAFGYWMPPAAGFTGDTFDRTLTAATDDLDPDSAYEVIVWQGHTNPDASTIYDRAAIVLTDAQVDALFPSDEPEQPTDPVVTPPTVTPAAGSLSWGVKASFREYVLGPIAGGSITTSGVGTGGGGYLFPQSSGPSAAGASYSGSVRFTGHGGALDLTLSSPRVRIDSASSGTLFVRVDGAEVAFATLALGSPTTGSDGSVRYSGAAATLTAAGAAAFDGFYGAGTALDPVTFVLGSAGGALGGTTVLASSFVSGTPSNSPDATPPATEGIELLDGEAVEGGEITITAGGFQPGETGILVVIYSEPTVLARDARADAAGTVSWTGTLPLGLTGRHTLTLQGSVDRGVVLDIEPATRAACTVSDATLVWGVKESFRAYIDGSIANGEWTTSGDVSYQTPVFTWTAGEGGTGSAAETDVAFRGAIRFTGHDGALDTTLADPRIVIDGAVARLLLDVSGITQEGAIIDEDSVPFAELDLSAEPERDGDTVSWVDVPATLTAQGADAFGTYPAGEALDPVTLTVAAAAGCADAAASAPEGTEPAAAVSASGGWPLWATIAIAAAALLLLVVILAVVLRRRRTA